MPLEQFEIHPVLYAPGVSDAYVLLSNASILFGALILSILGGFHLAFERPFIYSRGLQYLFEKCCFLVISIIKQHTSYLGLHYYPLLLTIFILVLSSNLIGLIPWSFTATSHLAMTLSLALSINLSIIILGFENQGLSFLNLFVPRGGPKFLFPLISAIELISYLLRTFSLSIRLFANMMAGHILLYILASFCVSLSAVYFGILMAFPFILVFPIIILEFGIAFLQAYVFIVLISIYLNEAVRAAH